MYSTFIFTDTLGFHQELLPRVALSAPPAIYSLLFIAFLINPLTYNHLNFLHDFHHAYFNQSPKIMLSYSLVIYSCLYLQTDEVFQ